VSRYIDEHRGGFGVEPICRDPGVSASAYYQRASGQRSARAIADERLLERIREVHRANFYAYGSRRMWIALGRAGEPVARCTVERLMRTHGICGAKRRGKRWKTTRPDPDGRRRADLVERDFRASAPNRLWVADLSYLRCWEGVVFFAFVIDVFSRRIVGWQFAPHMRTTLVLDALRMALAQRGPGADVELVHHSDSEAASTPRSTTRRRSPTTASSRRSARSATPTTRWPNRSSTRSRPSSSAIASGAPAPSSSSPSSSTSAGLTAPASTPLSATAVQRTSRESIISITTT
jgi:putative transposase